MSGPAISNGAGAFARVSRAMVLPCVAGVLLANSCGTPVASAAGDANRPECSNEGVAGYRAYLPDCRAYEQVSPPFKEGQPMSVGGVQAIAADGGAIVSQSLGVFAGAENDVLNRSVGTQYQMSRTGAAWSTRALAPAAAEFATGTMLDTGPEAGGSLWLLQEFGQPVALEELYFRSPGGTFTHIGPANQGLAPTPATGGEVATEVPVATYRGASQDLRHVFVSAESSAQYPLWRGDASVTAGPVQSLYEYEGTGNREPRLVGVSGGRPEGHAFVNEGAALIGNCGTILGGQVTAYNAVSDTGDVVFFTAMGSNENTQCKVATEHFAQCEETHTKAECEKLVGPPANAPRVNEVYARVNAASSLAISEPSLETPGRECTGACEAAEATIGLRQEGVFEGASHDGQKVFFRTSQPLINADTDNTGDLYVADVSGGAVTKLIMVSKGGAGDPTPGAGAETLGVVSVSEDGSEVYFVARGVLTTKGNVEGAAAKPGADNLYAFDTRSGELVFVGDLAESDERLWRGGTGRAATTPDGRHLVFQSAAHLTKDDKSAVGMRQVFEYNAETEELARVSIGSRGSYPCTATTEVEEGFNCDGNIQAEGEQPSIVVPNREMDFARSAVSSLTVSDTGAAVVFQSRDALTPGAVQGVTNVYEYSAGNVYLISDGHDAAEVGSVGAAAVELLGMDGSGRDVYFMTADSLVPWDVDSEVDIYDARQEGGFPAPTSGSGCAAEGCLGPAAAPFSPIAGASEAGTGETPLEPPNPTFKRRPTRAEVLAKALKACRRRHRHRHACEAAARKRYAVHRSRTSNTSVKGR